MSHTLHREGSKESLSKDYVVLAMPCQGRTIEGSGEKLRRFMQMAMPYHPVNFGNSKVGNSINLPGGFEELIEKTVDGHICHVVFNDANDLYRFICDLKQADMGISIVVSGLMDAVGECCHKAGIIPHSVNMSLGIYGKTEKLVPDDAREVTTMCGHGMVPFNLIIDCANKIKAGKMTARDAAEKVSALCDCGIFNTDRAEDIFKKLAEE